MFKSEPQAEILQLVPPESMPMKKSLFAMNKCMKNMKNLKLKWEKFIEIIMKKKENRTLIFTVNLRYIKKNFNYREEERTQKKLI